MRKNQQKQILDLINSLREDTTEIKRLFTNKDYPAVIGLLANCQNVAVEIGNYIETIEGEGTKTVSMLEKFCDILYQISVDIETIDFGFIKRLNKQLVLLENSVRNELKVNKIEIAFISYEASMSDSIETIYLAAKADPDCDAYWIPIPYYYDRKPDGSMGRMQYDSDDSYGDNIECTDWREYDVEARHPDAIFTFNPYDSANFITTVHPDYYCKRLRKLTDMLIYVPYFVVANDVPELFCITAGCIYAHKVIVQSEKVRESYIRVQKENIGNKLGKPEEKFLALGSPKFDKVINTDRSDYELPDEWQKRIGDKRVVLFNTTVNSILQGSEQYLQGLRRVFDTFRNRDDTVLWWRPHPLTEATFKSIKPQLFDEFKRLVSEYKQEVCGVFDGNTIKNIEDKKPAPFIYDDTSDMHRAIAWSDVYYGEMSSVAILYKATGKLTVIADPRLDPASGYTLSDVYEYDNSIWFSVRHVNGLFKIDKQDQCARLVAYFPGESRCIPRGAAVLYQTPVEIEGLLYFPPSTAKEIAIYSPRENSFTMVPFDRDDLVAEDEQAFLGAVKYGRYVFFTPLLYPAILALDTETNECAYYKDSVNAIKKRVKQCAYSYFSRPTVVGKTIWLTAYGTNTALEFDMETRTSVMHEIGQYQSFSSICFDGANFWLALELPTSTHYSIIKWHPELGVIKEFPDIYIGDKPEQLNVHPLVYSNGYVWVFPVNTEQAFKINIDNYKVSPAQIFQTDRSPFSNRPNNLLTIRFCKDKLYTQKSIDGTLAEYDFTTQKCNSYAFSLPKDVDNEIRTLISQILQADNACMDLTESDGMIHESGNAVKLTNIIDHITTEPPQKKDRPHDNCTAGFRIYRYVKEQLLL